MILSDVLDPSDAARVVLPQSCSDKLNIHGEGVVLGFPPSFPRNYDEYLSLGFAKKHVTRELMDELLHERVIDFGWKGPNLIVNAGLLQIINLVTGNVAGYTQSPPAQWFAFAGVGSGTTTPASGDTDLTGPYIGSRLQCSAAYNINSNVAKFDTFVSPPTWQGTWYECGNFTSITTGAGAMGSHLLINAPSGYLKGNNSAILDIQWTI